MTTPKRKLKTPLYEKYRNRKPSASIRCKLCGKKFKNLATHLHMAHNVTTEQYREEFPETKYFLSEDLRVEKSAQTSNYLKKAHRMLSEEEIAYVKKHFYKKTNQAIADDLGFSLPGVQHIIAKYITEKKQHDTPWKEEEIDFLIKNHTHENYATIAGKLGKSVNSVHYKAYKLGLEKGSPALPSTFYPEGAPRPGINNKRLWSEEETDYLKRHYTTSTIEEIAEFLGRSAKSIVARMIKLQLPIKETKNSSYWKKKEIRFVEKHYKKMTCEEMGRALGRSPKSVMHRMQRLGLYKMENRRFWTDEETEFLLKNYKKLSYRELGDTLGRSKNSIDYKMNMLGIRKTKQE
jgi:hypothetical protein